MTIMNNSAGGIIDNKLQHLIHKIIKSLSLSSSSILSSKQLLDTLVIKHREYKRKNSFTLQTQIDEILIEFAKSKRLKTRICSKSGSLVVQITTGGTTSSAGNGTSTGTSEGSIGKKSVVVPIGQQQHIQIGEEQNNHTSLGNKRKRNSDPLQSKQNQEHTNINNNSNHSNNNTHASDDEEAYDKAAIQNDILVHSLEASGTSSMLNANLRNRYKDVQRERDIIARKKAKANAEEENVVARLGNNDHLTNNEQKYINDDDNQNSQDGETGTTNDSMLPSIPEITSDQSVTNDTMTETNKNTMSSLTPSTSSTLPTTTQNCNTPLKKKKKRISKSSSSNNLSRLDNISSEQSSSPFMTSPTPRPKERYSDLGGITSTLTQIRQLIEYPLSHPELFAHLGIHPPRGVLLRGPPGCGKTHIANAIAGQLNVTFYKISAPEIVSSMSGESESRLRDLFSVASSTAPSIIFMDEIDAIAPKRGGDGSSSGGSKSMEKRIVAQLLTCMDSLTPDNNRNGAPVMVLGATNRPDSIDSALRRAGRFDREIILGVPDEEGRESILKVMTNGMRLSGDINFKLLAKKTPGFVGADIRSLTKEAGVIAINRIFKKILIHEEHNLMDDVSEHVDSSVQQQSTHQCNQHSVDFDIHSVTPFTSEEMEPLSITMSDFLQAVPHVQPSSKREGFATVPDVSWDNIGALHCIREELTLSVLEPITHPEKFKALGLPLPAGVLLYGPPGCGKTLLAKAIANESGANFISVKGPELLDKYVGESERAVRQVFERARSSSPCIVFFDELDSLCPKRGSDSSGGGVSERVVNQLLTEMDGLDSRRSVFVIAATNRPELIDPAMLRPGRLDKLLYVPLPSPDDRVAILKANARNIKLGSDVDLEAIAMSSRAEGYSGADCAALLREAGLAVLRDDALKTRETNISSTSTVIAATAQPLVITAHHFNYAFNHVMPSVSRKDQARYDKIRDRMARARTRGSVTDDNQLSTSPPETTKIT